MWKLWIKKRGFKAPKVIHFIYRFIPFLIHRCEVSELL